MQHKHFCDEVRFRAEIAMGLLMISRIRSRIRKITFKTEELSSVQTMSWAHWLLPVENNLKSSLPVLFSANKCIQIITQWSVFTSYPSLRHFEKCGKIKLLKRNLNSWMTMLNLPASTMWHTALLSGIVYTHVSNSLSQWLRAHVYVGGCGWTGSALET